MQHLGKSHLEIRGKSEVGSFYASQEISSIPQTRSGQIKPAATSPDWDDSIHSEEA